MNFLLYELSMSRYCEFRALSKPRFVRNIANSVLSCRCIQTFAMSKVYIFVDRHLRTIFKVNLVFALSIAIRALEQILFDRNIAIYGRFRKIKLV